MDSIFQDNLISRKKILLIDDDGEHTSSVKRALSKLGLSVHIASTINKAMKSPHHEYDLIMVDIEMANQRGMQILKHLKVTQICQKVPVIVVSKSGEFELIDISMQMGAVDFVTKNGSSLEKVVTLVSKHLLFLNARKSLIVG
jgi:DNA-binding NtrC family response regulator